MKRIISAIISSLVLCGAFQSNMATAAPTASKPEIITTNSDSDLYISDAAYFHADSVRAVLLVPGFIFNKESWFRLAKPLQAKGVASLSLSAKTVESVSAGIKFLKDKGHKEIILVGGSSGAAAILNTLTKEVDGVTRVATLSAVRGGPLASSKIEKLFIVSKDEKSYSKVNGFYNDSSEPKSLKVFDGKKHAQFLFFSEHNAELMKILMDFILKE